MEAIRALIEWIANDAALTAFTLVPYLLLGLVALYLLSLLLGYLRVSQVGIGAEAQGVARVLPLARTPEGVLQAPRGVPYCPVDGLQFPAEARFCTTCERDLSYDCTNCGATLRAADASCYRCGTRTGAAPEPLS